MKAGIPDLKITAKIVFPILILLGVLAYSNSFQVPFHYDDENRILAPVELRDSSDLKGIWRISRGRRFVPYYTFALNFRLGGVRVGGFHVLNLVIHLINAILVFFLVRLLLGLRAPPKRLADRADLVALTAALIFLLHPVQTQAVTYIVQRMSSLAAMFYLGCVYFYLLSRKNGSPAWGAAAFISGMLGMYSKETCYTLPFMLLFCEFAFIKEEKIGLIKRILPAVPFFLLIGAVYFTGYHGQVSSVGFAEAARDAKSEFSRSEYLMTQFSVLRTYLRLFLLPLGQTLEYDYTAAKSFFELRTFASFLTLLVIALAGVFFWRRIRLLSFSIFWFFVTLSIESSIFPVRHLIFEHRMYLPMLGLAIPASVCLGYIVPGRRLLTAALLLALVLGTLTYIRNRVWQSDLSLWQDVVSKSPQNETGHHNYGNALVRRGRLGEAEEHQRETVRLNPEHSSAYNSLGVIAARRKKYSEAISHYQRAIALKRDYAEAHFNMGEVFMILEQNPQAESYFKRALALRPGFPEAAKAMGELMLKTGRYEDSEQWLQKLSQTENQSLAAMLKAAVSLSESGDFDRAIELYRKIIDADPNHRNAHYNLGNMYLRKMEFERAVNAYKRALAIDPVFPEGHDSLADTYAYTCEVDKAIDHYQKALEINPLYPDAERYLDMMRAFSGETEEARTAACKLSRTGDSAEIKFKQGKIVTKSKNQEGKERQSPQMQAGSHLVLAKALLARGNEREGLFHLEEAVRKDAGNAEAYTAMGLLHEKNCRLAKAVTAFHFAQKLKPSDGFVENKLRGINSIPGKTPEEKEQNCRDALGRQEQS